MGIDEAGYGPNLGPMVMSAVIARSPDERPPDLWADLPGKVCRAGGDPALLWVDDSKAVYHGGQGRDRLEAATLAVLEAVGNARPRSFEDGLKAVGAGGLEEAELTPWLESGEAPFLSESDDPNRRVSARYPFEAAPWRLVAVRSAVVGPSRFNAGLRQHGSKAVVHFEAFAGLLREVWGLARADESAKVRGDKHGGRHFYYEPLLGAFPDTWIDRFEEGPKLSRYLIRQGDHRLELSLQPGADAHDGLVALASLVSKALRERWMDLWNAYWIAKIPGLRPTAGYPVDASRFRTAILPHCEARGLTLDDWWRAK